MRGLRARCRLELGGKTPAIYFGLHALHCSARIQSSGNGLFPRASIQIASDSSPTRARAKRSLDNLRRHGQTIAVFNCRLHLHRAFTSRIHTVLCSGVLRAEVAAALQASDTPPLTDEKEPPKPADALTSHTLGFASYELLPANWWMIGTACLVLLLLLGVRVWQLCQPE